MNKFLEDIAFLFDKTQAAKSRQLIAHCSDAIIAVNRLGLVTVWNPAAEKLFGYFEHEVLGSDLALHIVQPKNQKNYYNQLFQFIENGDVPDKFMDHTFETSALRRDGISIAIELSIFQLGDPEQSGEIEYAAIVRDISHRKQSENQLKQYAEILEMAVVGISFLDIEGYYTQVNDAYAKILGYTRAELLGMHWSKTVQAQDIPAVMRSYQEMLQRGKASIEAVGVRKNQQLFYKEVMMVRHNNGNGEFAGHYCFMKDISHLSGGKNRSKAQQGVPILHFDQNGHALSNSIGLL